MEYTLKHVSGPTTEPVSLAEVKDHLNMDPTDTSQDQNLETSISAARIEAESYLGKKIGTQTWDIYLDGFPWWDFRVPLEPLISIDSITYTDEDGLDDTVPADDWAYSTVTGRLWLKRTAYWPSVDLQPFSGVRVRVTVGITQQSDGQSPETLRWPDNIRKAILFRIGTFHNIREDMTLGTTMQAMKVGTFEALLSGDRLVIP